MSLDELVVKIKKEFESEPSDIETKYKGKNRLYPNEKVRVVTPPVVHASIQELHVKNMIADWIRTNVGQITT